MGELVFVVIFSCAVAFTLDWMWFRPIADELRAIRKLLEKADHDS